MRNHLFALMTLVVSGFATTVSSEMVSTSVTSQQLELVLENPANKIVSTLGFQSSNSNSLYATCESGTQLDNLDWVVRQPHDVQAYYDRYGILTFGIRSIEDGLGQVSVVPDDWFNTVYISLVQKKPAPAVKKTELSFNWANSDVFQDITTSGGEGEYECVELLWDDRSATNQDPLVIFSVFEFDTTELGTNDFVCEIVFVQRNDLVDQDPAEPTLSSFSQQEDGEVEVFWNADTSKEWVVQCQNDLGGAWTYYCTSSVVSNGMVSYVMNLTNDTEYFRLTSQTP